MRSGIRMIIFVTVCQAAKALMGKEFIVVVFSNQNSSVMDDQAIQLTNQHSYNMDIIVTTTLDSYMLTIPCRNLIHFDVGYFIRSHSGTAVILFNSSFEFDLRGLYTHIHQNHVTEAISYHVLPMKKLGKVYRPSIFLSNVDDEARCFVGTIHDNSTLTLRDNNGSSQTVHIQHKLNFLEIGLKNLSNNSLKISANNAISIFCGEKGPTNEIRFNIPPMKACGTEHSISTFKVTFQYGRVQRRIIKIYASSQREQTVMTSVGVINDTKAIEIDNEDAFNISAPGALCVLQSYRRWDATNASFIDSEFQFLYAGDINNQNCKIWNQCSQDISACCECACPCKASPFGPKERERRLNESLTKIRKRLFLKKSKLSSSVRKKISTGDDRASAAGIGVIGASVLVAVIFIIALCDVPLLTTHFKTQPLANPNFRNKKHKP